MKCLVVHGGGYKSALIGDIFDEWTADWPKFLDKPQGFGLVLFTGGEDVHPSFYNDTSPLNHCWSNIDRDRVEKDIFDVALKNNIPMTGICRGSQFLNVMAGGRMMHHIDNHGGCHHGMTLLNTGGTININSLHHQMSIPGPQTIVVGVAETNRSHRYIGRDDKPEEWNKGETEAIYMPHINAVAVQYHPEMMRECPATQWYRSWVEDFVTMPREEFEYHHIPRRAKHAGV